MHGTKAITDTIPSGCLHTLRGQKAQQAAAQEAEAQAAHFVIANYLMQ
jgi:hypothetical protein